MRSLPWERFAATSRTIALCRRGQLGGLRVAVVTMGNQITALKSVINRRDDNPRYPRGTPLSIPAQGLLSPSAGSGSAEPNHRGVFSFLHPLWIVFASDTVETKYSVVGPAGNLWAGRVDNVLAVLGHADTVEPHHQPAGRPLIVQPTAVAFDVTMTVGTADSDGFERLVSVSQGELYHEPAWRPPEPQAHRRNHLVRVPRQVRSIVCPRETFICASRGAARNKQRGDGSYQHLSHNSVGFGKCNDIAFWRVDD